MRMYIYGIYICIEFASELFIVFAENEMILICIEQKKTKKKSK